MLVILAFVMKVLAGFHKKPRKIWNVKQSVLKVLQRHTIYCLVNIPPRNRRIKHCNVKAVFFSLRHLLYCSTVKCKGNLQCTSSSHLNVCTVTYRIIL